MDVNQLAAIQKGDKGERVRSLQEHLKKEKYMPEVTGVFDVKTMEALRKLQSFYKIPETGKLCPLTMLVLNSQMMANGPHLAELE